MRILSSSLLATALLLGGATGASAFAVNMSLRPNGNDPNALSVGDSVVVDFFLDADQRDLELMSFSVLFPDEPGFSYDPAASAALPVIYPAPPASYGTTGAAPGYILYAALGMGTQSLQPVVNPFRLWQGATPPGEGQVNVDYAGGLIPGAATGSHVWVASMVFNVYQGGKLTLSASTSSSVFRVNGVDLDPSSIAVSDPISLMLPEPTTATLMALGILGIALAARRR